MLNILSPRGHWEQNRFSWRDPRWERWDSSTSIMSPKERVRPSLRGQTEARTRTRTCSLYFHVKGSDAPSRRSSASVCAQQDVSAALRDQCGAWGLFTSRMGEVLVTIFSEDEQIAYQWRLKEDLKGIIHPSFLFAFLRIDPSASLSGSADAKHWSECLLN